MTDSPQSMKSKNSVLAYVLIALSTLIVVAGIIFYIADQNKKVADQKTEDDRISSEKSKSASDAAVSSSKAASLAQQNSLPNILLNLPGRTYTASRVSVLTSALVFPTNELKFTEMGGFSLVSSGLDLAILGSPDLKIGNSYPTLSGNASGTGSINKDGKTIDLNVTNLKFDFLVDGQVLDTANSAKVVAGLAKAGLIIPTASTTSPVTVNVEFTPTPTGLTIKSTKTSNYLISFEGVLK